jgi:hypothetical protein
MQQRFERARPGHRGGLIRRLFPGQPHIVDLTSVSPADDDEVMARLERLEDGVQVIAETLRKTSLRLWGSIEDVRGSMVPEHSAADSRSESEPPDEGEDALTALRRARFANLNEEE